MTFAVASYNVLATAYIRRGFYPHTRPELLEDRHRIPAACRRVADLGADVYCLQEVDAAMFAALDDELAPRGYQGRFALRPGARPDGCATFIRHPTFRLVEAVHLAYAEGLGPGSSGHIAQLLLLQWQTRRIGLVNTHLKWDPPHAAAEQQYGPRQVRELLAAVRGRWPKILTWLICGDLNAQPQSSAVQLLLQAGYRFLHADDPRAATSNANGRAKLIDYIFFPNALRGSAAHLAPVDDATPLPSDTEPSDHVPVLGRFEWL